MQSVNGKERISDFVRCVCSLLSIRIVEVYNTCEEICHMSRVEPGPCDGADGVSTIVASLLLKGSKFS